MCGYNLRVVTARACTVCTYLLISFWVFIVIYYICFSGFLAIPKPTKGNGQHGHHSEEPKERSSSNPSIQTEEKQVKLKKNVDLFSGIALIVGTMIGKSSIIV